MEKDEVGAGDRVTHQRQSAPALATGSRFRLLAPAVTPVGYREILGAIRDHRSGVGRAEFCTALATMLDADAAATYTSYRRALSACFHQLDADHPDRERVLVPAYSSPDFAKAIEGVGLPVDRYDVDPNTLSMDTADLVDRINSNTLAVVAVSVLGFASPMDEIAGVCSDRNLPLVEAIGYGIGTTYRGRALGSFGDYTVVNFQEGKPIPVGGGMVLSTTATSSLSDTARTAAPPNVAEILGYATFAHPRAYRIYSAVVHLLERLGLGTDRITTHPGSKSDADYDGTFETMSNFQGAVGRRIFDRLDESRRARTRAAQFYQKELADSPPLDNVTAVEGLENHQHVRYPLLVDSTDLRDQIQRALRASGVQTSRLYDWPPVDASQFPGAASVQRRLLTLPTHPYTTEADRRRIVENIRSVIGTSRGTASRSDRTHNSP